MQTPGRRERKKAATRQALADAALELFLERGYDQVSIRDIAEAADVSTTTLFKHFPGKEALVFDEAQDREANLIAAVRERERDQSVVEALREYVLATWVPLTTHPQYPEFTALVSGTPALQEYGERMWTRHAAALGLAIAEDAGLSPDDISCHALARFVLDIPALTRGRPDPRKEVEAIFDLLTQGWR